MKKLMLFFILCYSSSNFAAPFKLTWSDTLSSNGLYPTGVNVGDTVSIILTVDNGNTDTLNQTWIANDLTNITVDANNGAYIASWDPLAGNGLVSTDGNFSTDGSGTLISAPSLWDDGDIDILTTDSLGSTLFVININGFDHVFINDDQSIFIDTDNVSGNTNPANWVLSDPNAPVSISSTLWLMSMGIFGFIGLRKQTS